MASEPYDPDNLLDRRSRAATLERHYDRVREREQAILARRLGLPGGEVLSVGCGWHPGRHLFPAPGWRMTAVDADSRRVGHVLESGKADAAFVGQAGSLAGLSDGSFDVVLYRLVLHHLAYQGSLAPVLSEARRLLAPGGALVAVEPNLWHPVGAALQAANRLRVAERIHGTPDDIPLSPRRLARDLRAAGLRPELHAVTYGWRRLPAGVQRVLAPLDAIGSLPVARALGHTTLVIGRAS